MGHAVQRFSCLFQRAVASDDERAARDAGHETAAVAAPCMHLSCPRTRTTIPDPPDPPTHTRRARSAKCAPRSSSCTLLVVVEAAGPVAGVIGDMVRLRSAVDETTREVLYDAHWLGAGHRFCSTADDKRSG